MAKKSKEEALGEDQLICVLSSKVVKATPKELNLQSIIEMLNEEYGFELRDMERDWPALFEDEDGKARRMKLDLAIFDQDSDHDQDNLIRAIIVNDEAHRLDFTCSNGYVTVRTYHPKGTLEFDYTFKP